MSASPKTSSSSPSATSSLCSEKSSTSLTTPTSAGTAIPSRTPASVNQLVALEISSVRSEEHTSELQSHSDLVCRLLLEKKKRRKARRSTVLASLHQQQKSKKPMTETHMTTP